MHPLSARIGGILTAAALAATGPARPANQDIRPEPQRRAAASGRARY